MKHLIFPLLVAFQMHAQEVLFEGHVYDYKTKAPIPYVNLSFLNTLKGTSTDDEGHFFMDLPESYLDRKVHISSLGYKDTIVVAQQIFAAKRFEMVEESFELDEVVVSESLGDSYVLNPIASNSITSGFSSSVTPWVLALYFPNIGAQKKYVEKVTVFLNKTEKFKRTVSKFRIRIYDVDSKTKKPHKDLLRKSFVLEHLIDKDFVSLDLSSLNIEVPKDGIYVGLEWLFIPSNWYMQTEVHPINNKNVIEDRFAPTFAGMYTRNQNYKVMIYGMGEWTDFKVKSRNNDRNFIPAISLKLKKE